MYSDEEELPDEEKEVGPSGAAILNEMLINRNKRMWESLQDSSAFKPGKYGKLPTLDSMPSVKIGNSRYVSPRALPEIAVLVRGQ